jgi:hypothetical protein
MKTIVEQLIAEVREDMARWCDYNVRYKMSGGPCSAEAIRNGRSNDGDASSLVGAGLTAIAKYFEDYEEVEARDDNYADGHIVTVKASMFSEHPDVRHYPILILKPAPKKVEVTRETLARLTETVHDIPEVDGSTAAALREADALL